MAMVVTKLLVDDKITACVKQNNVSWVLQRNILKVLKFCALSNLFFL